MKAKNSQLKDDASPKRLNIILPERTVERISKLKSITLASSNTDVIRTAILTYEALVEFLADGNQFYVCKRGEDRFSPVTFMFDVPVKKLVEENA